MQNHSKGKKEAKSNSEMGYSANFLFNSHINWSTVHEKFFKGSRVVAVVTALASHLCCSGFDSLTRCHMCV